MKTDEAGAIEKASEILNAGGLVAFPTETVYGLGGNALDASASSRIYAAKGRPSDNPLIVHIADTKDVYKLVTPFCYEKVHISHVGMGSQLNPMP